MTQDIIRMAREAGFESNSLGMTYTSGRLPELLERFAALVAANDRNKLATWMIAKGYATGHGDTMEGLLEELRWQVRESEREACLRCYSPDDTAQDWADKIRARGQA
jgi:hypothetical protein